MKWKYKSDCYRKKSKANRSKYDDSMTSLSDKDQNEDEDSEDTEAFLAWFDEDGHFIR